MKMFLKRLVIIVAAMFCVAGLYIWLASRDSAPSDVSDLVLERPQLDPQINGYTYFLEAVQLLAQKTNNNVIFWYTTQIDTNAALQILKDNEPTLKLIEKMTTCDYFRQPEASVTNIGDHISARQKMTKLLSSKIRFDLVPSGRTEEAVQTGITLLKYANMNLQDVRCLLDFSVSAGPLGMGLFHVRNLAASDSITSHQLSQLSNVLDSLISPQEAFSNALKGEFQYVSSTIDKSIDGTLWSQATPSFFSNSIPNAQRIPAYWLHPNTTKKWIADECRIWLKNSALSYAVLTNQLHHACDDELELSPLRPNEYGYVVMRTYKLTVGKGVKSKCKLEAQLVATRLVVACHRYRIKNGVFPRTLQELVPAYIAEVPIDPYDGKPFRYKHERKIVYSIGEDLVDSDGTGEVLNSSGYPIKKGKDLVFSLDPS